MRCKTKENTLANPIQILRGAIGVYLLVFRGILTVYDSDKWLFILPPPKFHPNKSDFFLFSFIINNYIFN